MAYAWSHLGIPFTFIALLKLIVFIATASMVMVALQNAAAATCFWIQNSFYILDLTVKFKDYAKYPITIFSPVFKFIFTFIIPIAFIAYYPSLVILRPDSVPLLTWFSPIVGIIAFFLSYKLWMFGATRYNGTGS
ncbi:MAG TPA: ABC-2 family transporter protein [Ruminococcus sp.]|nr:ABC-2 family transporter protein [Ruminococcus sp.]